MRLSSKPYYLLNLPITLLLVCCQLHRIVFAHPISKNMNAYELITNSPQDGVMEACDKSNSANYFIYCSGKLLQAVNYHGIYKDSKTFVDKPLKQDAKIVAQIFEDEFPEKISEIEPLKLQKFLDQYFHQEGNELDTCDLDEWQSEPPQLKRIKDKSLQKFAFNLNDIWKKLCRKIKPEVKDHPDRHSLIYVDKPFIVPGGRFREFYYWDAYWIVKGLIASGLLDTTKNMIQNFVQMVEQIGFVPNGGRVYYLQRSQPPFLIPMVYEYYQVNRNTSFIREILPVLEKEVLFWDQHRQVDVNVNGETHTVYQYRADSNVPRPESYKEDIEVTAHFTDIKSKRAVFKDLASAAESGWDFSSRWFRDPTDISTIKTTKILPVDLNAFICWNLRILTHLFTATKNMKKAAYYSERYRSFLKTFETVFYVRSETGWYDYDMENKQHNFDFFPSVASPLFTGCYDDLDLEQSAGIFDKMEKKGVFNYVGGIPTSLNNHSGQQWDYPNGWSPLNHMIIEGLRQSRNPRMQQKAYWLAEKWVLQNYRVFMSSSHMWEKYNVIRLQAVQGAGGEYEVQEGFGWSNGAVLDLMRVYSDRLNFKNLPENPEKAVLDIISHPPQTLDKKFPDKHDSHKLRDSLILEEIHSDATTSHSQRQLLPLLGLVFVVAGLLLV